MNAGSSLATKNRVAGSRAEATAGEDVGIRGIAQRREVEFRAASVTLDPVPQYRATIDAMRIGELAARAGVNVQTILYYERRRLLPRPPRTSSGYRSYTEVDAAQVQFIRQTQQLGFTLNEIAALLPHHGSPRNPDRLSHRTPADELALYRMVNEHLSRVEAQITVLQQIRDALCAALDESRSRLTTCPAQEVRGVAARTLVSPPGRKRKA